MSIKTYRIIASILFLFLLSIIFVPVNAENINGSDKNEIKYIPEDIQGIDTNNNQQSVLYANKTNKYPFAYDFINYVNAKVNFVIYKKQKINVYLNTTTSGGEDYIYYRIYKSDILGLKYLKQLKFSTAKAETKTTTLNAATYTFRVSKAPSRYNKKKRVVGSGYMKTFN